MSEYVKEFYRKWAADSDSMKTLAPNLMAGFGGLFQKTMGDGALSVREKELIALGIAVGIQCEPCILLHVKKCLEAGATKEQVIEAAQVAAMMAGGPAFTHVPLVLDALKANDAG